MHSLVSGILPRWSCGNKEVSGLIAQRFQEKCLKIAAAVVNELEVIISWNFERIVKLKTRTMVNGLNRLLGCREIEICSPEEVVARAPVSRAGMGGETAVCRIRYDGAERQR